MKGSDSYPYSFMGILQLKKVLVVGANGVVGFSAMKYFREVENVEVIALSRKNPYETFGAEFISVDLLDLDQCKTALQHVTGITHVVYCAVFEKKNLREGWLDEEQISNNDAMLRHLYEAMIDNNKGTLQHITLLQGTKAYGTHIGEFKIPAKEGTSERRDIPNFYWKQEDFIKEVQKDSEWNYSILRPRIIFGEAIGSAMNIITAIAVYASILKEVGEPLHYPGTQTSVIMQAVDADLLAAAISWAGESEHAKNETFNVTNGDIFVWYNVWPAIAKALHMEMGDRRPVKLVDFMKQYPTKWDEIRKKYQLDSPTIEQFVNSSFEYADGYLHADPKQIPAYSSTIKIHAAGFHQFMDTEEMFVKWFNILIDRNLIPR